MYVSKDIKEKWKPDLQKAHILISKAKSLGVVCYFLFFGVRRLMFPSTKIEHISFQMFLGVTDYLYIQLILRYGILSWSQDWLYWYHPAGTYY